MRRSSSIARLERTELQHLEITMKTYCVSDFEQGIINSSPPPQELVLEATTDPCAENVGNRQSPQDGPPETAQQIRNVGKRKTPADLLELIPSESPIPQAKLFEPARAAGINEKYARQFLSVLITEKGILVQKIPREKAKSALGYVRASSPVKKVPAAKAVAFG